MTVYTVLPQDDLNLEVTVIDPALDPSLQDDSDLDVTIQEADNPVVLNITPASVNVTSAVLSVNSLVGHVNISTTEIPEGTNQYYTDARADARVDLQTGANLDLSFADTDELAEGPNNLYYTDSRAQTVITANTEGFIKADSTDTLSNKSGNISQWTNDAGYITEAEDNQTLSFNNPDLTISNGNTIDISGVNVNLFDQTLNTTDDVEFNTVTADFFGVQHFTAKAREAITAGQPVYISGHSGNTPEVKVADFDDPSKMPAFGIASADIGNNNNGTISTYGDLKSVDTTGSNESETWAVGDELFVNNGKLTNTRPTGSAEAVQKIAKIIRVHQNNGQMFLMGAGRSNDIPNLDTGKVFIGNGSGYDVRALTSADVSNSAGYITASTTDTLTNKSGNISMFTNDAGYLTSETDNQTLTFTSPNLAISNGNSVDLSGLIDGGTY